MNVKVKYTCKSCHLTKVELEVPARKAEDVVAWMKKTTQLIANNHLARNPACKGDKCDIMIPIGGTDKIGGPTIQ